MLDLRIYRAAFVPAVLALVVVAFSLQDRPRPIGTTLAPDAFQGPRAFASLSQLADTPSRRPGDAADADLGRRVAQVFGGAGFAVRTVSEEGRTVDGTRELDAVIAERPGTVDERVVVLAHRDAAGPGARAELSGTAGLLELARVFGAPRRTRRTLTLVSTSGGSGGAAGASVVARELAQDGGAAVSAVLVLGDLASVDVRRPLVTSWSNALGVAPLQLRRTVEEAVRAESSIDPGRPRPAVQFARLAAPLTFGEQGALLARGLPAVLLSVTGERPPAPDAAVSEERLVEFGRAALRTVTALDRGPLVGGGPEAQILTRRAVVPGWAVRLLTGALLLPVLLAAVDGLARVRRRREPVGRWVRWTLAGALPFALCALLLVVIGRTGLLAAAPGAPVDPAVLPAQPAAIAAALLVLVLGWIGLRPLALGLLGARGEPEQPAAAAGVLLVLAAVVTVVWVRNPFAAAVLLPALHLWMLAVAPELRARRGVGLALVGAGLVPVLLVGLYYLLTFDLGPLDGAWLALLLVAGGHVSVPAWLLGSALAACAAAAVIVVLRAPAVREQPVGFVPGARLTGPGSYLGPGSLGGTDSALRR